MDTVESDQIQLIIKAPNQNVDDQIIHCSLEWTVEQLKIHLSEVYPNKPAFSEQKIIYSGRLLHDHLHLKDVLRHEDKKTSVHTLHLVCNRQWKFTPKEPQQSYHSFPYFTSDSSGVTTDSEDLETEPELTEGSPTHSVSDNIPVTEQQQASGVNIVEPQQPATQPLSQYPEEFIQMMNMQQLYRNAYSQQNQNPGVASTFWPSSNVSPTSPDVASQMAAMQQLYASYYQYLQNMHVTSWMPNYVLPPAVPQQYSVGTEIRHRESAQTPPPAAAQPQNVNFRMNAHGGPILNDNEHGNRDWLDYFYLCCRGFVLFSIVYFYSSPERLMLVIVFAFLALLYQEGWILARARNNRLLANRANRARQRAPQNGNQNETQDAAPVNNQNGENIDRAQQNTNEIEAIMDADDPPHAQHRNPTANQNPAWTFVSSFFSSLIPEPPAPVNLN